MVDILILGVHIRRLWGAFWCTFVVCGAHFGAKKAGAHFGAKKGPWCTILGLKKAG